MSQKDEVEVEEEKPEAPEAPPAPLDLEKLLEAASDPLTGLLASGTAFFTGIGLLMDDAKDFGELLSDWSPKEVELPTHPHHWIGGALLMMGGAAGMGVNLIRLIQKNPLPPKMPRSTLEGAPWDIVERFK